MNKPLESVSTHGHTVLHWLAAGPMSREALRRRVDDELGSAASFHTCDRAGLGLDDLLALLAERGKILPVGDKWTSDMSKVCADA